MVRAYRVSTPWGKGTGCCLRRIGTNADIMRVATTGARWSGLAAYADGEIAGQRFEEAFPYNGMVTYCVDAVPVKMGTLLVKPILFGILGYKYIFLSALGRYDQHSGGDNELGDSFQKIGRRG